MKLLPLALLSLTALVGAQSVSVVVNGLDALTAAFHSSKFETGDVMTFSSTVDGLTSQIQGFTDSIAPTGQKRGYPVARNLSARTTFSDADATQVIDAFTSLVGNAEDWVVNELIVNEAEFLLAGQANAMYNSVSKLQQAFEALATKLTVTLRREKLPQVGDKLKDRILDFVDRILEDKENE